MALNFPERTVNEMPMGNNCEGCGTAPPIWEGRKGTHGYCSYCSKDLCDSCIKTGHCEETQDSKHLNDDAED